MKAMTPMQSLLSLMGVICCRHGLAHTDQHILYDPKLCFKDLYLKSVTEPEKMKSAASHNPSDNRCSSPAGGESIVSPVKAKERAESPTTVVKVCRHLPTLYTCSSVL